MSQDESRAGSSSFEVEITLKDVSTSNAVLLPEEETEKIKILFEVFDRKIENVEKRKSIELVIERLEEVKNFQFKISNQSNEPNDEFVFNSLGRPISGRIK